MSTCGTEARESMQLMAVPVSPDPMMMGRPATRVIINASFLVSCPQARIVWSYERFAE